MKNGKFFTPIKRMMTGIKKLVKSLLRKLGLLKPLRRLLYKRSKRKYVAPFDGVRYFDYCIKDKSVKFSVADPYSATFAGCYLKNKIYEAEAVELLCKNVSPNDVFADVGANIGYFTLVLGVYAPQVKIVAFEMGAENARILQKNLVLNNLQRVELVQAAVADTSGYLYHQDSAVGNAVLKIMEHNLGNDPDVVKIRSVALDDFFLNRTDKPTFIKIDVEGAEMKVLQGMKQLLKTPIKLLLEIHPADLRSFGSSRDEVLNYLKAFDFKFQLVPNNDKKNELVFAWK